MDFLEILKEIRGSLGPGEIYTDGLFWELTIELHNGNPGIYGDILAIYEAYVTSKDDFDVKYQDFLEKYADMLVRWADVVLASELVSAVVLGAKTEDPIVDNNGDPLQVGAIYYNITLVPNRLRVFTDTGWDVAVFDPSLRVISFNGRNGYVTLLRSDIEAALGHTVVEYTSEEKGLVDIGTPLETVATTLTTSVNEVLGLLTAHRASTGDEHTFIDQDVTTTATPIFAGIITAGDVDGRDLSVDGAKLDLIEAAATADQTGIEVKALYEVQSNAYTDAKNVKLNDIEIAATADQTSVEIEGLYEGIADTNKFTDAKSTQVDTNQSDILLLTDAVSNIALAQGSIENPAAQPIDTIEQTIAWNVAVDSSNLDAIEFDAVNNVLIFKNPGDYNMTTNAHFVSSTASAVNATFNWRDAVSTALLSTRTVPFDLGIGGSDNASMTDLISVLAIDTPRSIKLSSIADLTGISIGSFYSTIVTNAGGTAISAHSGLTGTNDPDSHPITAITGLTAAIDSKLDLAGGTITNDLTISGNLYVTGNEVIVNTATVQVEDNIITLNHGELGAGITAGSSGIEFDRGTEANYEIIFDELDDSVKIGTALNRQKLATREDTPIDTGLALWNAAIKRLDTTLTPTLTTLHTTGAITTDSTIDGRDVAADGVKLDFATITQAVNLDALEAKSDLLTVTQAVNLDTVVSTQIAQGVSLTEKVALAGDSMTGPLHVPAGSAGTQVPQAQEVLVLAAAGVKTAGDMTFNDNVSLFMGTGQDVQFFCNSSHMYMDLKDGIGNFYIRDGITTRFTFDDAGSFTATGNITAYSDIRVKDNIEVIPNALSKVLQLSGYTFDRTDIDTERQTGVIAQEVQAVLPEAVVETEEGTLSVAYGNMVGLLIESIKELEARVASMEAK